MKPQAEFSDWQWRKEAGRVCKGCAGCRECSKCEVMKPQEQFSARQWRKKVGPICQACSNDEKAPKAPRGTWRCGRCHEYKPHSEYTRCPKSYRGTKKGRCDVCLESAAAEEQAQLGRVQESVVKGAHHAMQKKGN